MAKILKHIGKMKKNGAKVLIIFRTLPGESDHALVVSTASLSDADHNAIITLVESAQAQDVDEFSEILNIRHFPDGRLMLPSLHKDGRLVKVPTSDVLVTPTPSSALPLSELNMLIAEQKGVTVDGLAELRKEATQSEVKEIARVENLEKAETTQPSNEALSDQNLAKNYRSQADSLYKEAARLRKQADEIDPPKKKTTKAKEEVDA